MRILIFTQKMDRNDSVLGFFHDWVIKISEKCEEVQVICLEKGECSLPQNVKVYSLGKEIGVSKLVYVVNLYKILNRISGSYDRVFVHMNQEYILLAGLYWKLKGIPVYLWRNHPAGSLLTLIAVALSKKVFCTSSHSFTARFKKTIIMPAGIDTETFKPVVGTVRKKYSVGMIGRIAPVKHNDLALRAMKEIISTGGQASLLIVGSSLPRDKAYYDEVKQYVLDNNLLSHVSFLEGVPPSKLPEIYSSIEICLNLTDSGSFDKTIVESASCGAIPVVSNSSLKGIMPSVCIAEPDVKSVADSIQKMLLPHERIAIQKDLEKFVEHHSLNSLMKKLMDEIK